MASKTVRQQTEGTAHQFRCVRLLMFTSSTTVQSEFRPLPRRKRFRFYSTLKCVHGLQRTEAGNMREIKNPCSAPRPELTF
jgi:hypothetical protein